MTMLLCPISSVIRTIVKYVSTNEGGVTSPINSTQEPWFGVQHWANKFQSMSFEVDEF